MNLGVIKCVCVCGCVDVWPGVCINTVVVKSTPPGLIQPGFQSMSTTHARAV